MAIQMIATIYSFEPVIAGVTKFGADQLHLLIDKNPNKELAESIEAVKKALGSYVNIILHETDIYDIYKVAEDSIRVIDTITANDEIHLNISAARKTKALGLMYAGYGRASKINNIFYITKEDKKTIILPKMSFRLTKSQKRILEYYANKESSTQKEYLDLDMSKSTFYKTRGELTEMSFIINNEITDAGKIALL